MFLALIIVFWAQRTHWWLVGLTILWVVAQRLIGEDVSFVIDFAMIVMINVFAATPVLLLFRFLGVELRWAQNSTTESSSRTFKPGQFTIASLMGWTAAVAIILGTLSYLRMPGEDSRFLLPWMFVTCACSMFLACFGLAILWLILGRRRLPQRVVACVVTCSIPVTYGVVTTGTESLFYLAGFIFCLAVTFCGLRWAGLEIVRHRRDNAPQTIDGDTGGALALCEGDRQ